MAALAAPLVGALTSSLARLQADPVGTAKRYLQVTVVVGGSLFVIFAIGGRAIAKQIEDGKDRTFDAGAFEFEGPKDQANSSGGDGGSSGRGKKINGVDPLDTSGGIGDWAKDGFKISGAFPATDANLNAFIARGMQESGGNRMAVNNWDSNAKRGTPSKGVWQIIDPTWRANAVKGYEDFNKYWMYPRLSAATSLNYMKKEYGYVVGATGTGY